MGLSNDLSCEAGSFSCCRLNPHGFISPSWSPGLCGLFCSPPLPPGLSMRECGAAGSASSCIACPVRSTIRHLAGSGCPSPPLLPVWMNVSSLSPWLWDFRAVPFSVSSSCFSFLNCCCPSFGCARRRSVSTYSSILAGTQFTLNLNDKGPSMK